MSFKSTLLAALAATTLGLPALAQEIHILDTYARSASPSAKTGAAFMLIENIGDADDRLIGAASPAAKMVQLHTHREDAQGVMQMVHVEEGFDLPAGETLVLQRGGHHVMFMGLTEPFEQGKTIPLTLSFEKSGDITLEIPVDLTRTPAEGHGAGQGHGTGN
jgi:copper(I)-binding protein